MRKFRCRAAWPIIICIPVEVEAWFWSCPTALEAGGTGAKKGTRGRSRPHLLPKPKEALIRVVCRTARRQSTLHHRAKPELAALLDLGCARVAVRRFATCGRSSSIPWLPQPSVWVHAMGRCQKSPWTLVPRELGCYTHNMTKKKAAPKSSAKAPSATTNRPPISEPVIASSPAAVSPDPSVFLGEAALEKLRTRLAAVPVESQESPRYNIRLGATAALRLAEEVERALLLDRLRKLHSIGEFDLSLLPLLPDLAHAAWYIRHRLDQASALATEARVPSSLVESASQLRQNMLRVLDFHFGDDPTSNRSSPTSVAAPGTKTPPMTWLRWRRSTSSTKRPWPAPRATTTSTKPPMRRAKPLPSCLRSAKTWAAMPPRWVDLQRRISPLLKKSYEEIAQTARYLTRKDPQNETRFPRLHNVARARSQRSRPLRPIPSSPHSRQCWGRGHGFPDTLDSAEKGVSGLVGLPTVWRKPQDPARTLRTVRRKPQTPPLHCWECFPCRRLRVAGVRAWVAISRRVP